MSLGRWERLIRVNDPKLIWNAINWKGNINDTAHPMPPVKEFKTHFENLLNPRDQPKTIQMNSAECPYMESIKESKADKACGINGISSGIFKILPFNWILCITFILNIVFHLGSLPTCWMYSKRLVTFKKGTRLCCGNYRGISINDSLYRIFDKVLYSRLTSWYIPSKEQAGCQKNRGCLDQIITIRLLSDYAKKSRKKLFLLFIDFEKAYDKVPRVKLMNELKRLGCGKTLLTILSLIYVNMELVF